MPEVLEGVIRNNCILMPITSNADGAKRYNMYLNWVEAFDYIKDDLFIGLDSDVILTEGVIDKLVGEMDVYDLVVCGAPRGHGLWCVKTEIINKIPMIYYEDNRCPTHYWFNEIKKDYKVVERTDYPITECDRLNIKREANYGKEI